MEHPEHVLYEIRGSGIRPQREGIQTSSYRSNVVKMVLAKTLIEAVIHVIDTHGEWEKFTVHSAIARSGGQPVEWAGVVE